MKHTHQKSLSGLGRHILIIPVLAGMLVTLACTQTATLAKNDTLSGTPITVPDIMPVFPGGEGALLEYISRNLVYPQSAMEQKIEGRVTIRFVIDTDGWTKKFEVVKSVCPSCDQAAIEALRRMPRWKPGQKNGVNVPVYFTLPILFKLNR